MKLLSAFALLAAVASAAPGPSAFSLEQRDEKCLPQRIAVVVLDNSYTTYDADEKYQLRQEVAHKVFSRMTPDEDKGAFMSTENNNPQILAAMNTVNHLQWPTPGRAWNDRPLEELVDAAVQHIKATIKEDYKDRTAIVLVTDWLDLQGGVDTPRAIRDAKDLGIRVHWARPNENGVTRDIGAMNSAVIESGGWYSEINDIKGLDYFTEQLFKKGLTNKDEECAKNPKPDPAPTPSAAPQPSKSENPPPPPPTENPQPSKSEDKPQPSKSQEKPPAPTTEECKAQVSTVTEKVTETIKETVTAPAPSATGNVCLAPCDVPGAKPLPAMPKFEL